VLPAPLFVIKKCCWSPRHLDDGDGKHFGILVDALGDVLKVPPTDIAELAKVYVGVAPVLVAAANDRKPITTAVQPRRGRGIGPAAAFGRSRRPNVRNGGAVAMTAKGRPATVAHRISLPDSGRGLGLSGQAKFQLAWTHEASEEATLSNDRETDLEFA
jgi:hypothetical protein